MFRIFRKVREEIVLGEKSRRYASYAAGELVLVVLGILIALQINNWNEERIEQQQIADYAHALINDLERDLAMIEVINDEIDVLIKKIDTLAAYVENRSFDELRNIDLYYLMTAPFYRPYAWNRTAGTRAVALAGTIVDMNYQNIYEDLGSGSPSSFSFPDSPFHEAYSDSNLSLLTDSMEDVKLVVNSYLILGGFYGIRPRAYTEMPWLVEDARELIVLLKQEYPE
jgi:hypothetical protein